MTQGTFNYVAHILTGAWYICIPGIVSNYVNV